MKSREEILTMTFEDAYDYLRDQNVDWDSVNDTDTIRQYITEKMKEGIAISHMVKALEDNPSTQDLYDIGLDNSTDTPEPINTVEDLLDALQITFC